MILVRFFLRGSWGTVALAIALGLLGGACNAGLLALINTALHNPTAVTAIWMLGFAGLGLARVSTAAMSQYVISVFAQKTMADLRRDLCQKILATPLRHLEEIGAPRLLVALTEDVITITMALRYVPSLMVDITTLLGCFVYLGWLSWQTLLAILAATGLGLLCQRMLFARAMRYLRLARDDQDTLFRHFRALTEGVKELRMHRQRRASFFSQHIQPTTAAYERHNVAASKRFIIAYGWNQLLLILLVGLVFMASPFLQEMRAEVLTGYVMTILYMMGPLRQVMNNLPSFGRANIALQKIAQLELAATPASAEILAPRPAAVGAYQSLELRRVTFAYQQKSEDGSFVLGPLDFTLSPGEVVFVVGGNGSGKSTLAKLLTGLYPPDAGEMRLDGQLLTEENREWYRQHFSVVFADFYLFESLLGLVAPDLDTRAQLYLERLQLDHKVKVQQGVLSTIALSQGQRKRLALLTAYLEDRPIYVFDEWAADQDPQFKQLFYLELLPDLKARGKTVVVISHDDRYFHVADRLVKLDYGKLVHAEHASLVPLSVPTPLYGQE